MNNEFSDSTNYPNEE